MALQPVGHEPLTGRPRFPAPVAGVTAYEGMVDKKFGLEVWTGLAGGDGPTGAGVEEASVRLALPEESVFVDEQADPTASVFVRDRLVRWPNTASVA